MRVRSVWSVRLAWPVGLAGANDTRGPGYSVGAETSRSSGRLAGPAVTAGRPGQAAAHPGRGVGPRPLGILPARPGPGRGAAVARGRRGHRGQRLAPVRVHGQAEHLAHPQRHPPVPLRPQVQPVGRPHPRVGQHPHRPQVDQQAVVAGGDDPQVRVERGRLAADHPDQREQAGVEPGEQQHPAARRAQPLDGVVERLGQDVGVGTRPEQVVAARGQADQVGPHGHGRGHLVLDHLGQHLAADGQVGVAQARRAGRHPLGGAVRPAPPAAVGPRIAHALAEAVPQCHKRLGHKRLGYVRVQRERPG